MEMTTIIKNPIFRGELFLLGAKEDKKVIENKSTICVDRLAAGTILWPKLSPRLSLPEIKEDFLTIKGSKLPMKPKKCLKRIPNAIHDVSPGFWLSTVFEARYKVRENKSTKKMEMTTTIKNPTSHRELFLLGAKEDEKVMENKSTICVDRLIAGTILWPKLSACLSRREKEEDFLVITGSTLPMKPKKRFKHIQNAIHDVSPGFWPSTISEERYEVGENKSTKKRARGSKAMKGVGSDLA